MSAVNAKLTVLLLLSSIFITSCAFYSINSPSPGYRILAIEDITDQDVLEKVAMEDVNSEVRVAAVKKLTIRKR